MFSMTLLARLSQNIQRLKLSPMPAPLIVGVSGGADSVALLHALNTLNLMPLHVATLNHGLRGQASADDAEYVRALCDSWGVAITVGHAALDPHAPALEARARHARYAFFAQVAQEHGATVVAVAHHADDQAETVLLRLIRGTGLHGLSAMQMRAPLPDAPDLTLIRPMLNITRAQIIDYCTQHGITARHDASNDDTRHARNYIRHEVLPRLTTLNPQVTHALTRLAESAALDEDYLHESLIHLTQPHTQADTFRLTITRGVFVSLHPALRRRWLMDAAQRLAPYADIPMARITAADETLMHGQHGAVVQLGAGLLCRREYERVCVEYENAPPLFDAPQGTLLLAPDTEYALAHHQVVQVDAHTRLTLTDAPTPEARALFDAPHDATLTLRTRRTGDTFAPPILNGHTQTLKKWMIDHKIPRTLRDRVALITHENRVLVICWGLSWRTAFTPLLHADSSTPRKIAVISTL